MPSREMATKPPELPLSLCSGAPIAASQSITELWVDLDTIRVPSYEKVIELT